jgi:hypothetical protein
MTARRMMDRAPLTPGKRKEAYANRFKPTPALPDGFDLGRAPRDPPRMIGREEFKDKDPKDITPRELVAFARKNTVPVLERLYAIAMIDTNDAKGLASVVEACSQFLNRAGLYEVKGQVAAIYAKVQGDMAKLDKECEIANTIETEDLAKDLGPKGEML